MLLQLLRCCPRKCARECAATRRGRGDTSSRLFWPGSSKKICGEYEQVAMQDENVAMAGIPETPPAVLARHCGARPEGDQAKAILVRIAKLACTQSRHYAKIGSNRMQLHAFGIASQHYPHSPRAQARRGSGMRRFAKISGHIVPKGR